MRTVCITLILLFVVVAGRPGHSAPAEISPTAIAAARTYCSSVKHSILLNADRTILCFDGRINHDLDVGIFHNLKDHGVFVIRSPGGYSHVAMAFANILRAKDATVVLYDHCLSACANYVLIASNRTYVTKGTIVAWHHVRNGPLPLTKCLNENRANLQKKYREYYGDQYRPWHADAVCKESELLLTFFKDRSIGDGHTLEPQTIYTKKMWTLAVQQRGDKASVFWMWNPKNQHDYFKSRITYEGYPTEDEVGEFVSRLQYLAPIVYDPDPG
jgi:hypothetical protein